MTLHSGAQSTIISPVEIKHPTGNFNGVVFQKAPHHIKIHGKNKGETYRLRTKDGWLVCNIENGELTSELVFISDREMGEK